MFLGTYNPRLDDKGRLILPAKFRDELAEGLVIVKGQEHCLFVRTKADFFRAAEELRQKSIRDKAARDYSRLLFAGASDEELDRQGRITIPPKLREYARLTRECAVVGANDRIEIWDAAAWDAYETAQESEYADLSEGVASVLA